MVELRNRTFSKPYISPVERSVAAEFRVLLSAMAVGDVFEDDRLGQHLGGLEWYIPELLRGVYPEWKYESLDGIKPLRVQKVGPLQAEVFGCCILINDQKLVPLHLRLQLAEKSHKVQWLECRLGENIDGELKRDDLAGAMLKAMAASKTLTAIDWYYSVSFGERSTS